MGKTNDFPLEWMTWFSLAVCSENARFYFYVLILVVHCHRGIGKGKAAHLLSAVNSDAATNLAVLAPGVEPEPSDSWYMQLEARGLTHSATQTDK